MLPKAYHKGTLVTIRIDPAKRTKPLGSWSEISEMLRSLNNYDFFIDERIGQIYNEGDLSWERSQALELAKNKVKKLEI